MNYATSCLRYLFMIHEIILNLIQNLLIIS